MKKINKIGIFIGTTIVFLALGDLWFHPTGAIWLLKNIPPWVFHYLPNVQTWLIKEAVIPDFSALMWNVLQSVSGIAIIVVFARLEIKIKF